MLKIVYQNAVKAAVLFSIFHRKTRRFSHELKHLHFIAGSTQPSAFPLVDTAAQPVEASFTPSEGMCLCRRPAAGEGRPHGRGAKGDRTPMVSCPLLTLLTFLWPSHRRCSAKRGYGARFRASFRLWMAVRPCGQLAQLAAHNSARPYGAGRSPRRCEQLRFHQE